MPFSDLNYRRSDAKRISTLKGVTYYFVIRYVIRPRTLADAIVLTTHHQHLADERNYPDSKSVDEEGFPKSPNTCVYMIVKAAEYAANVFLSVFFKNAIPTRLI